MGGHVTRLGAHSGAASTGSPLRARPHGGAGSPLCASRRPAGSRPFRRVRQQEPPGQAGSRPKAAAMPLFDCPLPQKTGVLPLRGASVPLFMATLPKKAAALRSEVAPLPVKATAMPKKAARVRWRTATVPVEAGTEALQAAAMPVAAATLVLCRAAMSKETATLLLFRGCSGRFQGAACRGDPRCDAAVREAD